MTPQQRAIVAGALEAGVDPSWALAVAERESNFNPRARSSKTIRGAFQMTGKLRDQFGIGDSDDLGVQTKGWARFFRQNKYEMAQALGRDPTDEEGYLGHHFGGTRAARMLKMDPNTPVDQVFTPTELALNPHLGRAGTVGAVNSSIIADMQSRHRKFGGELPDLSADGTAAGDDNGAATSRTTAAATSLPDFSSFGKLASLEQPLTGPDPNMALEERKFSAPEGTTPQPPTMEERMPTPQDNGPGPSKAIDLAKFGTPA